MASVGCQSAAAKKEKRTEAGEHTGSDETAAPGETLAGQDTLPAVAGLAVGAKHVANLATRDANVAGGHVGVGANVLGQLAHKGLAEAANLGVALALGVEVGTALAAAHVDWRDESG